ncbi:transient receptor potential channel pyrexia [Fusarium mundagurra]|uniref:Transient receptor potential channel pyrexia n=1 Tax=Fusarium mundagurra TaxID=1567541 RepID=A0A8H5YFW2_9HYPO|nr:transient receptor potential channel pyrexia [Fusarium mundagurra]
MDGLSAAASIIAVVQLTAEVTKYIIGVAGASKDRQRLLDEILACEALLMRLRDYSKGTDGPEVEDWHADQIKTDSAQRWSVKVKALESDNAPLYRLCKILDAVKTKLQPGQERGIQKVKAALKWPFDEKEVAKLVDAFQRERSLLHFAMTHESTQLVKQIKATSDDNSRQLADLVRLIKKKLTEDEHRVARLDCILTDIQLSNLTIAEGIGHLQNSQMSAHQKEVLDWISPVDYAPQQSDIFSRREPGTGEWLLESDEYNSWVKGDKQTLFCPGIPGAGKTIMASIVVNSLLESFHSQSNIGVAYIYCNFRRRHEQKASDLVANLLKQLSENQPSLFKPVEELYNKRKASRTRPSLQELGRVLQLVAATYSRVYIVLDALDECETTDGTLPNFIQQVLDLQSATSTNILATSRYIPEIKEKFRKAVSLKIRASEPDNKPELQEEIKTRILESVQGMFLLAQLHLDSLVGKRSPKAVRTILKALPSNSNTSKAYDKAYGDAMKRIEDQLTDQAILAKEALMWISCARRLLSPVELQHALGIEIDSTDFDEENLSEIPDIVSACAGLVTVDEQSNTVRLAHFTTQEYFERTQDQWFPNAAQEITVKTLTYLSYDLIVDQVRTARSPKPDITVQKAAEKSDAVIDQSKDEKTGPPSPGLGRSKSQDWKIKNEVTENDEDYDVKKMLRDYPLCRYASCHWGYHARNVSEMPDIVKNFLSSEKLVKVTERLRYAGGFNPGTTGLHEAAYFGFEEAAEWMLQRYSIDALDSYNVSILEMACGLGHLSLAETLLKKGANLRGTPITYAARRGQDAIVTYLFQYGAPLEPGALEAGFRHFNDSKISVDKVPMFQTLLEHGADPNILIDETSRPLHHATWDKVEPLIRILLDHAADVNGRDKEGRTALHLAVDSEMESLVRLLVDRGAEVNAQDDHGHTPLYHTAGRDIDSIVQLLVDHGANAILQDKHGLSVPHLATGSTFGCLVRGLIGCGESTNAHGTTHKTHLTAVASNSPNPAMLEDKPQKAFEEYPLITIPELALFRSLVSSNWPSRRPPGIAHMEEQLGAMQMRMEWEYEPLICSFLNCMSEKRVLTDNFDKSLYDQALDGVRPFVRATMSEVKVNIQDSQGYSSICMENMHEASRTLRMYSQQLSAIEFHREMALALLADCAELAEMLWENNAAIKAFDRARYGELMLAARKGQDYIDQKLHVSSAADTTLDTGGGESMTVVIYPTSIRLRELRQRFHIDLTPEPEESSPFDSQPKLVVNLQLMEASHTLVSVVP